MCSLAGMDWRMLLNADPLVHDLAIDVLARSLKFQQERDQRLAMMIIEELAKAMNRK